MLKKSYKPLKKSPLKNSGKGLKRGGSLKKSRIKLRVKTEEELEKIQYERDKMNAFWVYCFQNLQKYSEIYPYKKFLEVNKCHYHHLLSKSQYEGIKYALGNIFCCTFEEHQTIENDYDYYPIIRKRMKECLENYKILKEQSNLWSETYDKINKK